MRLMSLGYGGMQEPTVKFVHRDTPQITSVWRHEALCFWRFGVVLRPQRIQPSELQSSPLEERLC
jgi:hypothetical protein